jgi:hypothetical protein
MSEDPDPILWTLMWKLPFFMAGVALGMAIVYVALQWVPEATVKAFGG